jgi:hypothetical protein
MAVLWICIGFSANPDPCLGQNFTAEENVKDVQAPGESLQPLKKNIQHFTKKTFSSYAVYFCSPADQINAGPDLQQRSRDVLFLLK